MLWLGSRSRSEAAPVVYSIYLLNTLPSKVRTFSAAAAPNSASNVNGANQLPSGDIINENLSSIVRWNRAGQRHSLRVASELLTSVPNNNRTLTDWYKRNVYDPHDFPDLGMVGKAKFEARIKELVENLPDLAVLVEPLLVVRRALREQIIILHRRLLAIVRDDGVCRRLMTTPVSAPRWH